ncbi:hypothetical protein MAPG_10509 [Magnaporthiopsis poae ATCC 64411]|uniref:Uncharacterized protein n=1 Tax=Magnaporthiopsis poae (strain ATCC 64411 / 73-15) TaxID=644358 RepID=A0A0C4ECS4_MAGP6|nr:hypothetical protein MAPG_10509 [Magnaporthiopsis poae ATCC 64411]
MASSVACLQLVSSLRFPGRRSVLKSTLSTSASSFFSEDILNCNAARFLGLVNATVPLESDGWVSTTTCRASQLFWRRQAGTVTSAADGVVRVGPTPRLRHRPPFLLPSTHGDLSTAWYDLPAANWLPVLKPNSTRAMDPARIKPLQLTPGVADAVLVDAVKSLLADVNRLYAPDVGVIGFADEENPSVTVDQMGERVELDRSTGKIVGGTTYYGWSRGFCRDMKVSRKQGRAGGGSRDFRVGFHGTRSRSMSRDSRVGFHGAASTGPRHSWQISHKKAPAYTIYTALKYLAGPIITITSLIKREIYTHHVVRRGSHCSRPPSNRYFVSHYRAAAEASRQAGLCEL